LSLPVTPHEQKLFDGDIFEMPFRLLSSSVRDNINIPGVLILENSRCYGRTTNKKRLLYKCRPNNPKLPCFLIPYDMQVGFKKNHKNKYVTFQFKSWIEKHPLGMLSQCLGDVYDLPAFYEYQLYCKNLHSSITESINACKTKLRSHPMEFYENQIFEDPDRFGDIVRLDKTTEYIMSIDPSGCLDRDDALSISETIPGQYRVCVYIANVWVWLEVLELWNVIGSRVSTMYLPDKKRPMLPIAIGEELCSLDERKVKFAWQMEFHVVEDSIAGMKIDEHSQPTLTACSIRVNKNFAYESTNLLSNSHYMLLKRISQQLDSSIQDSHEVVSFWMTQMNIFAARQMKHREMGIFRVLEQKSESTRRGTSKTEQFLQIWESHVSGKYVVYQRESQFLHALLNVSEYIHFTSPIRRMVDLLNQIHWVCRVVQPKSSIEMEIFLEKQTNAISDLNCKMKATRKVQTDCDLLYRFSSNKELLHLSYTGIVLESSSENKYKIYVEEIGSVVTAMSSKHLDIYDKVSCKFFVFDKEDKMYKKVRVQIETIQITS
jgi:exoribonuclease R